MATKFDHLCPRIRENAGYVYNSPKARASVMAVAKFLGLQVKHIFPVVNYVNDNTVCQEKNILAIEALYTMVKLMQDHLESAGIYKTLILDFNIYCYNYKYVINLSENLTFISVTIWPEVKTNV